MTLAAGAAHELGTPLGTIAVVARELERYAEDFGSNEAVLEDARLIRSEVERCRRILERMSAQSAELPEAQRTLIKVEVADEKLAAVLPAQATAQSLAALLQNALDANLDRRAIMITAAESGATLRIVVEDHGHGMPANVLRRIAKPFSPRRSQAREWAWARFWRARSQRVWAAA